MRYLNVITMVFVCALIYLVFFLALRNYQEEGVSLKTCMLMSGPLLIWFIYTKLSALFFSQREPGER